MILSVLRSIAMYSGSLTLAYVLDAILMLRTIHLMLVDELLLRILARPMAPAPVDAS